VRVFIAIDIPEEVRRRIGEFAREMRDRAPHARWVRVDGIHITLKFIGEVPSERVEAIRRALAPVRASEPIRMDFRDAGFFPDERRPRVFWVGIHASPALAELAAAIEQSLEPLGIARESRAFQPHLTLARFERPSTSGDLRRALAEGGKREFGSAVARAFHLYESRIGPGGARYTRLETFVFAPETS
jgi:2'-5' RNA ligase